MPTYEYECEACGHAFSIMQSITDKKLSQCPKCRKLKLARLIGIGSGIVFKGTGFYETDYKRKAEKPVKEDCSTCCAAEKGGCPAAKKD